MLMRWVVFGLLLAVFAGIFRAAAASRRLLVVRARAGRIVRARGRAPGELLHEIEDIVRRGNVEGELRVVIEGGAARVIGSHGLDAATLQQVRNVVGRFPLQRLRTAPHVR